MRHLILVLLLLSGAKIFAQQSFTVKGSVKDTANVPFAGATVTVINAGKDTSRTVTNTKGEFSFTNMHTASFTLIVQAVSTNTFKKQFDFQSEGQVFNIRNIVLTPKANILQGVTVTTDASITIKEDTVSYKADSFAVKPNSVVEDLLKKLPGIEVDKDGNVTAQGKSVTKVKVNGKDFFNGDMKTATRELPANIIDKVDIIDDYGDQAAFTGIKDGDPQKVLNLQIKKDRNNGYFGNVTAGKGTEDRYTASLSAFRFNNDRQLGVISNLNNTNTDMFNFSAPGLEGGGGPPAGGGMRGGGSSQSSASTSSQSSTGNGITDTKSIGFNYRDNLSKKVTIYGSYMFTDKNTNTLSNVTQQNLFETNSYTTYQNSNQNTIGVNHRFSLNLEYNIDSADYLKVSPSFAYRTNKNQTIATSESDLATKVKTESAFTNYFSNATAPNFTGSVLFNHRFKKKGRNFSFNYTGSSVTTDQNNTTNNETNYYDSISNPASTTINRLTQQYNESKNQSMRFSYQEPLSKTKSLEFNYTYGKSVLSNDKNVYNIDTSTKQNIFIDSLSNLYQNIYYTNRFGINLRSTGKKYNYNIGMAVQPALVQSKMKAISYNYHLLNYMPVARFSYKFSRSRSFDINYMGSTSQPGYLQLQPVRDNSNPQNITVGNPDLKPEFANSLNIRYNNYDYAKGNVFFSNISYILTKDKIVTNAINISPGVQETHYLNDDGYYTLSGFYFFSRPFRNRRYVVNLNGTANYNNNVSYINSQRSIGRNWVVSQSVKGSINTSWLEMGTSATYTLNSTKYTLAGQQNTNVVSITCGSDAKLYLPGNFIISYDIQKTINKGYTAGIITNPFLINGYLEKKLFKKQNGSIRLQAFDVLNQNAGVSRTVSNNTITDTYSNRLGRYYMLTFALKLSRFAGASMNMHGMERSGMPPGGPPM